MRFTTLVYTTNIIELVAAILATIHYKKYATSTEKYFLHFLWLVVFTETTGTIVGPILKIPNIWVYIPYIIISFLFYFYWYYSILKKDLFKKIILFGGSIFLTVVLYDLLTKDWTHYHFPTFFAGTAITIIAALFYFSEVLNSNEVLTIKNSLRFWITTGLLLFNVGMLPFMYFFMKKNIPYNTSLIILIFLNIILYTCYSLGFIWVKKKKNS